jgi:hypothetical protein
MKVLTLIAILLTGLLNVSNATAQWRISPFDGPSLDAKMRPSMPDLVIEDMYFTPGTQVDEFTTLDLHIVVTNIGQAQAYASNCVKLFVSDDTVSPFDLEPEGATVGCLGILYPQQSKEVVVEDVCYAGLWCGAFLGVIDMPWSYKPRGHVLEGPSIAAEKNNTMLVPSPVF